jgi:hypothetical protein
MSMRVAGAFSSVKADSLCADALRGYSVENGLCYSIIAAADSDSEEADIDPDLRPTTNSALLSRGSVIGVKSCGHFLWDFKSFVLRPRQQEPLQKPWA